MTNAERQRLAAILGMLGSEHAGERAAAGLQAEAFRRKHKLTWPELLALPRERPSWVPPPEAQRPAPPPPPPKPAPFEFAPWTTPPLTPVTPKANTGAKDYGWMFLACLGTGGVFILIQEILGRLL